MLEVHRASTSLCDPKTSFEPTNYELNNPSIFESGYACSEIKKYTISPCLIAQKSPISKFVNSCFYGKIDDMQLHYTPKLLNKRSNDGECGILKAACSVSTDALEWLIKKKASVLARSKNGLTALHSACAYGRLKTIKLLISKGVDPLLCSFDSFHSPLHVALINDHQECAFLLLPFLKTVDLPDSFGVTPLHLAVLKNMTGLAIKMIKIGCNINRQTLSPCYIEGIHATSIESPRYEQEILSKGISPLHIASWQNNDEMVLFLLQNGANPSLKDAQGNLPEHYCNEQLKLTLNKCRLYYEDYTRAIAA